MSLQLERGQTFYRIFVVNHKDQQKTWVLCEHKTQDSLKRLAFPASCLKCWCIILPFGNHPTAVSALTHPQWADR